MRGFSPNRLAGVLAIATLACIPDWVMAGSSDKADLKKLATLQKRLKSNGCIWVVYPKGKKHITENDVLAGGRQSGLVDVKVIAIDKTWSGLKFVRRLRDR